MSDVKENEGLAQQSAEHKNHNKSNGTNADVDDHVHLELEIEGRDGTEMLQAKGKDLATVLQQVLAFAKLEDG